jgi:ADP-ribose pyrophosphatase YjhB (NUDIX family)
METKIVVVVLVERDDGSILLGQKPKGMGPYPNTWHIPGGKVKENETFTAAVKREIMEEAGIAVIDIEPIACDEDITDDKNGVPTHYLYIQFKAKHKSGELKPGDDMVTLKWVGKASLKTMNVNMPTFKLFKKIGLL